jgi:hypothetical protein
MMNPGTTPKSEVRWSKSLEITTLPSQHSTTTTSCRIEERWRKNRQRRAKRRTHHWGLGIRGWQMALCSVQMASRKHTFLNRLKICIYASVNIYATLQMPHLQRRSLPLRLLRQNAHEEIHHRPTHSRTLPPRRLSARRRSPRPLILDPPPLNNRVVSRLAVTPTPIRNQILSHHLRQTIPMLGVRRGFPGVDEREHAEGQQ